MHALEQERRRLAADLRGLTDAQWSTASLCAGWTVHHVLAHLCTALLVRPDVIARRAVRHRSVAAAMDVTARELAQRDPVDLLDVLEQRASSTFRPPGLPLAAPLTDAVAHGADIRWALSTDRTDGAPPARLLPALRFVTGPRARIAFVPHGRLTGLRLETTDLDWSHGVGAPVRGPALAVLMGVLGRPAARTELHGDGVARLLR